MIIITDSMVFEAFPYYQFLLPAAQPPPSLVRDLSVVAECRPARASYFTTALCSTLLCTVHSALHYWALCTLLYTIGHCAHLTLLCTVHTSVECVQCTQCKLYTSVHIVHYTLYTALCTL